MWATTIEILWVNMFCSLSFLADYLVHYIKMNGGRRPTQGRGTANQNEPGRGKHPHSSTQ